MHIFLINRLPEGMASFIQVFRKMRSNKPLWGFFEVGYYFHSFLFL